MWCSRKWGLRIFLCVEDKSYLEQNNEIYSFKKSSLRFYSRVHCCCRAVREQNQSMALPALYQEKSHTKASLVKEGTVQFNNPEKGFGGEAMIKEDGTYVVTNNIGGLLPELIR